MASGPRVRDWATVDFYEILGVSPNADADVVTRAFREQAKRSHPDAGAGDETAQRFNDVAAAYEVLGDARTRREYDRVRAEIEPVTTAQLYAGRPPAPPGHRSHAAGKPWSRRRAWTVLVAGVLVTVLGIGAAALTWSLHDRDARRRARFVPVTAVRVEAGGADLVTFVTPAGQRVRVPEPRQHGDPAGLGRTVRIRYDPDDPQHVITGASTTGRDITFAIIALKLLIGGPVFIVLGARHLRPNVRRKVGSPATV